MIPFSLNSGRGKIIGAKPDQWLPGAEGRNKVLTTSTSEFWMLLQLFRS